MEAVNEYHTLDFLYVCGITKWKGIRLQRLGHTTDFSKKKNEWKSQFDEKRVRSHLQLWCSSHGAKQTRLNPSDLSTQGCQTPGPSPRGPEEAGCPRPARKPPGPAPRAPRPRAPRGSRRSGRGGIGVGSGEGEPGLPPQAGAGPRPSPQRRQKDQQPAAARGRGARIPSPDPEGGLGGLFTRRLGAALRSGSLGPASGQTDRRTMDPGPQPKPAGPGRSGTGPRRAEGAPGRAEPVAGSRGAALQTDKANSRQTDGGGKRWRRGRRERAARAPAAKCLSLP
nr:translation initiation factor IF-2-like [Gorilla gorilla gorilla]